MPTLKRCRRKCLAERTRRKRQRRDKVARGSVLAPRQAKLRELVDSHHRTISVPDHHPVVVVQFMHIIQFSHSWHDMVGAPKDYLHLACPAESDEA